MARALRASSALVVVAALCAAAPARAWTDAAVRSVQARVELRPDASARVTLTATVRVHGGWLEGLELAGLDPDLVLDETAPPFALDAEGQRYEPRAEVLAGGRVLLAFGRRGAPRRGTVTVTIAYATSLAHRATEPLEDEGLVRVRWTLPAGAPGSTACRSRSWRRAARASGRGTSPTPARAWPPSRRSSPRGRASRSGAPTSRARSRGWSWRTCRPAPWPRSCARRRPPSSRRCPRPALRLRPSIAGRCSSRSPPSWRCSPARRSSRSLASRGAAAPSLGRCSPCPPGCGLRSPPCSPWPPPAPRASRSP
ncbi:MAG: hypothetical protein M5U28_26990 [Sandaracinaceae bacterium]|nr:hypothetical protein [Sandaracinaceae bacterium]